jgi:hypothetical protein
LDAPWPTDERRSADGRPDLSGFPTANVPLTAGIIEGWARRLERDALGFGNNTGAWFRFAGSLDLPTQTEGTPSDPVVWIDVDTGELAPLDLRFIEDPLGDPFWAENTLAVIPRLGHGPRSGARVVVAVLRSAGAASGSDWEVPDVVQQALDRAGVRGKVAVATSFTVQDATGQLRALRDDLDARLVQPPVTFRRVVRLRIAPGTTESGEAGTAFTAVYEDGTERTNFLAVFADLQAREVDLAGPDWPMEVYEGELQTWNYQGLADRPYMRPGLQHVQDVSRESGFIAMDLSGVRATPETAPMRIVVAVPRGRPATGVLVYDHGTGGHAYEVLQRRDPLHDTRSVLVEYAQAGQVVIGRDASLYGVRYPLIEEGYAGGSLGFYNIVNLPAFRDNQRQTALDGHVVNRWVQDGGLERDLGVVVGPERLRAGHSLGSVTSNLGLAMDPDGWDKAMLTGTGGVFAHYFLDTGLLENEIEADTIQALFGLFGATPPDQVSTEAALGAAIGAPEAAWGQIDRQHPVIHLFQWTMDPSDPMAVAKDEAVPTFVVVSPGDWQTPDFTARALVGRLPSATSTDCVARSNYDPHHCLWREPEGPPLVRGWLAR